MSSFLVMGKDIAIDDDQKKQSFFSKIISGAKSIIGEKSKESDIQTNTAQEIEVEKVNPAENMPNPLFYDVIYPQRYMEEVPEWIYSSQVKYNQHIPDILHGEYIINDIFTQISRIKDASNLVLLIEAIQDRDDIDFNRQDKFGNTLLHYAIRYNSKSVFYRLLATKRVMPNICNFSSVCPIHLSIYKNDIEEVEALMEYGVDLQFANDRFEMPIITAIKSHNDSIIYAIAKNQKERGISMNEIDYIVYIAKEEGLGDVAKNLYEFFILGRLINEEEF